MWCSAVQLEMLIKVVKRRQVWWVAVETRTNESLVCLLKSLLFSAIESYRRLILAGRCRAHAFPTMESWLPSPVWNNLREARGWSDLAQAQGQAEGGDGNCEADSGGGGVLLCAYLWVSLKAKGKENFARSNLAMRCLRGKREEVFWQLMKMGSGGICEVGKKRLALKSSRQRGAQIRTWRLCPWKF